MTAARSGRATAPIEAALTAAMFFHSARGAPVSEVMQGMLGGSGIVLIAISRQHEETG